MKNMKKTKRRKNFVFWGFFLYNEEQGYHL